MTDEQKNTPSGTEQREENVDLYALFFKYFAYWPWFVASVLVCIISAFIYLRYQAPVYNVDAAVLIKEGDKKGGSSNNPKKHGQVTKEQRFAPNCKRTPPHILNSNTKVSS